jgi:hypothetical protein
MTFPSRQLVLSSLTQFATPRKHGVALVFQPI